MTGAPISYHDISDIDPVYYKNLQWILDNDVSVLDLSFCYEEDKFGQRIQKDLIPNGCNIPVTDQNKKEYINKICYAKMATEIKDQIEAFLTGLFEIVPKSLLQIFDHRELELMISGVSEINLDDLKQNTNYVNFTKKSEIIVWFWELMEKWNSDQRANFIQFVTGTSKVPIEGFKALKGIGGEIQKFQIHKVFNATLLPTAHTCLNQLELPEYKSKEILEKNLGIALELGKEGFGFE